ncbi:MAG: hypothetical protein RLZ12_30 [Bacillota bacterium]
MRFLYLTDTHIRGTSPRSRTDDFPKALKKKLQQVSDLVKERQIDYVLHGGDIFDRPTMAPAVVRDFIAILRSFERPIYAICGNHDIYGHNPSTVNRTMLGLLEAMGLVHLLSTGEVVMLKRDGMTVQLSGQPFHYELDKRSRELDYQVKRRPNVNFVIHMVHGMLVKDPLPEYVPHTMAHEVWHKDVDLLLSGHYHTGFNVLEKNGRYIINPGSLARVSSWPKELVRIPGVVIITCDKTLAVEEVALKNVPAGLDVLDRSYLEQAAYRAERLAGFVQQVRAASDFRTLDLHSLVVEIAQAKGLEDEVCQEACRRLGTVEERLAGGIRVNDG